jgi:hypothetical protein
VANHKIFFTAFGQVIPNPRDPPTAVSRSPIALLSESHRAAPDPKAVRAITFSDFDHVGSFW